MNYESEIRDWFQQTIVTDTDRNWLTESEIDELVDDAMNEMLTDDFHEQMKRAMELGIHYLRFLVLLKIFMIRLLVKMYKS